MTLRIQHHLQSCELDRFRMTTWLEEEGARCALRFELFALSLADGTVVERLELSQDELEELFGVVDNAKDLADQLPDLENWRADFADYRQSLPAAGQGGLSLRDFLHARDLDPASYPEHAPIGANADLLAQAVVGVVYGPKGTGAIFLAGGGLVAEGRFTSTFVA